MKSLLANPFAPILAQAAGGLAEGASKAMGIVMLIGFIFGWLHGRLTSMFTGPTESFRLRSSCA